jgi:hypothetical protein
MLLGDFSGAEQDLLQCDGKVDAAGQKQLLPNMAWVYLSREKWSEYQTIVQRLFINYRDSKNPSELNTLLWYSALQYNPSVDTKEIQKKLESLVSNPKNRNAAYSNTLALSQYRQREYSQAIRSARESMRLLKETPSPSDWMIIALSLAQLDEQRNGWLPAVIRSRIRNWGLSGLWSEAEKQKKAVDAWMVESDKALNENQSLSKDSLLLLRIELPHLLKEWETISSSR